MCHEKPHPKKPHVLLILINALLLWPGLCTCYDRQLVRIADDVAASVSRDTRAPDSVREVSEYRDTETGRVTLAVLMARLAWEDMREYGTQLVERYGRDVMVFFFCDEPFSPDIRHTGSIPPRAKAHVVAVFHGESGQLDRKVKP